MVSLSRQNFRDKNFYSLNISLPPQSLPARMILVQAGASELCAGETAESSSRDTMMPHRQDNNKSLKNNF